MHFDLGEPITSEESGNEAEHDLDDYEEEERELMLLRKVMQQQNELRGAGLKSGDVSSGPAVINGASNKPRESLASRYYRNRNLTWTKEPQCDRTDSAFPSSLLSGSNQINYQRWAPSRRNHTAGGGRNSSSANTVIPVWEGYLCHICGEKGHHIRNCPHGSNPKRPKKVKPATGLPRSWLRRIPDEEVARIECDVYSLPDGSFAVLKDTALVCTTIPLEKKIADRFGSTSASIISDHLRCPLCARLFQEAVLVPCCGSSYCRSCIVTRIQQQQTHCPSCGEPVEENDVFSNQALQASVDNVLSWGNNKTIASEQQQMATTNNTIIKLADNANDSSVQLPVVTGIMQIVKDEKQSVVTTTTTTTTDNNTTTTTTSINPTKSVPPGTIRDVKPVIGVKPLGGRLLSSRMKRPLSSIGVVDHQTNKRLLDTTGKYHKNSTLSRAVTPA